MTTGSVSHAIQPSPFKGQASFETEDETIFFGREQEASELTHQILSSRITVLHAPSGAGKTSLLNARIIPNIEREGWLAVRSRPDQHPSDAVKTAVLQYLLPPPRAELQAIERAVDALKVGDDEPFSTLFWRYRELSQSEPGSATVQSLIAPVRAKDLIPSRKSYAEDAMPVPMLQTFTEARPLVCRVLSLTLALQTALSQWAFVADSSVSKRPSDFAGSAPTVGDVRRALAREEMYRGYCNLLTALTPPLPGLLPFFRNLSPWCQVMRPGTQLVLILDQFEEIFVRFADPGHLAEDVRRAVRGDESEEPAASPLGDWRLRREFFSELEALHRATYPAERARAAGASGASGATATETPSHSPRDSVYSRPAASRATPAILPIRFVISLRDEYVARLTRIRRLGPDSMQSSYRLDFLSLDQAAETIREPIERRGREIETRCINVILRTLQFEEAFVEPGPLQIVSHYLWNHHPDERAITEQTLTKELGGVSGILGRYFGELVPRLIERLERDSREPQQPESWPREYVELEMLSMLNLLLTPSNTRNIVEERYLVHVPMRDPVRRQRLLDALVAERIVRRESRLNGDFHEIMHEFLTGPIRKALTSPPSYESLERALAELADARQEPDRFLSKESFIALHLHERTFVWDASATETMLRSAVVHHEAGASDEAIRFWTTKLQSRDTCAIDLKSGVFSTHALRALAADCTRLYKVGPHARPAILRALLRSNRPLDAALLSKLVKTARTSHDDTSRARD
jgi:hypothetical protein